MFLRSALPSPTCRRPAHSSFPHRARAAALAVLAACGALTVTLLGVPPAAAAGPAPGAPSGGGPAPHAVAPAGEDILTISVKESPDAPPQRHTLHCHPAGGTHPQAREACDTLDAQPDPFAPVAKNTLCTRIYGGPQTATVTGLWKGRPVRSSFSRSGGCEMARWDALVPVLPASR